MDDPEVDVSPVAAGSTAPAERVAPPLVLARRTPLVLIAAWVLAVGAFGLFVALGSVTIQAGSLQGRSMRVVDAWEFFFDDPPCASYPNQEAAQEAYDAEPFSNTNLDQDVDGDACEDYFARDVRNTARLGALRMTLVGLLPLALLGSAAGLWFALTTRDDVSHRPSRDQRGA